MKNKPKLKNEIRQRVFEKAGYKCYNCDERAIEAHHVISKTLLNIKLYGIEKIDSEQNLIPCCHKCHDKHSLWDGELRSNLKEMWKEEVNSKMKRLNIVYN